MHGNNFRALLTRCEHPAVMTCVRERLGSGDFPTPKWKIIQSKEEVPLETIIPRAGSAPTRQELITALNAKVLREQNLPLGILAGAGATIVGALIWMAITVATDMHIGIVAIGVGAAVGYAVRYAGKGVSKIFGYVG